MTGEREVPVHYLRGNEKVWTPPEVLFFDTETDEQEGPNGTLVLTPVAWAALYCQRRTRNKAPRLARWMDGADGASLAVAVDTVARSTRTLWCFAHNLSFDAAATQLPNRLVSLGWEVTDFSVRGDSPWFRFVSGDRRLVLVDSWSWLPAALAAVGEAVGLGKEPLPEERGQNPQTVARCRRDVEILAAAVLDLMGWWDREALGRWTITGAGCGWNAYRHVPTRDRVLIDPDPDARTFERQALYGGRREAFRVGDMGPGEYADWDLVNAYPTTALHHPLPVARGRWRERIPLDHPALLSDSTGVLAWATVTTEEPCVPCRVGGVVFYPVGTFRTVLASPEIVSLVKAGRVVDLGPGFVYRLGWNLEPWARWVLGVVRGESPGAPPVARIAAKHWSRAVLGKWSARTHRTERWGPAGAPGWHVEEARVEGHRGPAAVVDFGGHRHLVTGDQETDNAFPAISAFVESYTRLSLSRGMAAYRGGSVLSCDTDGFLATAELYGPLSAARSIRGGRPTRGAQRAREALSALSEAVKPYTVARKASWGSVAILGPQHVTRDQVRSFSGIRADAVEVAPGSFRAHLWPKLTWQMAHGTSTGYVRPLVTSHVVGPYAHRWVLVDGSTVAPRVRVDDAGENQLEPWPAGLEAMLAPWQHPALHNLRPVSTQQ